MYLTFVTSVRACLSSALHSSSCSALSSALHSSSCSALHSSSCVHA